MDRQLKTEEDAGVVYTEVLKNRFEAGTMDEGQQKLQEEQKEELDLWEVLEYLVW